MKKFLIALAAAAFVCSPFAATTVQAGQHKHLAVKHAAGKHHGKNHHHHHHKKHHKAG